HRAAAPRAFRLARRRVASNGERAARAVLFSHPCRAQAARGGGVHLEPARLAALIEVGNPTVVRERVRDYGWENVAAATVGDLRVALRRLRTHPGFAVVAVLTLALGIGAATAIFGAVNPILFEPLAYPHADRVVMVSDTRGDGSRLETAYGT